MNRCHVCGGVAVNADAALCLTCSEKADSGGGEGSGAGGGGCAEGGGGGGEGGGGGADGGARRTRAHAPRLAQHLKGMIADEGDED